MMVYKCPCCVLKEKLNPFRTEGCSKRCELRAILVGWTQLQEDGGEKLLEWKGNDKMNLPFLFVCFSLVCFRLHLSDLGFRRKSLNTFIIKHKSSFRQSLHF